MIFLRFARTAVACLVGLTAVVSVRVDSAPIQSTPQTAVRVRVTGFDETQAWFRRVQQHRVWERDAAVAEVAKLPTQTLQGILTDLRIIGMLIESGAAKGHEDITVFNRHLKTTQLAPLMGMTLDELDLPFDVRNLAKADNPARVMISRVMLRAAILHTVIASSDNPDAPPVEPVRRPGSGSRFVEQAPVRIQDGRPVGISGVPIHWAIARAALDMVGPPPSDSAAVRHWYHATAALMQARRDYAALQPHLAHAREILESDATTFLLSGAAFENLAAPPIQAAIVEAGLVEVSVQPVGQLRSFAESYLRRALELDADSALARLRLGRVLQLTLRHDEAAELLRAAEPALPNPRAEYLAALFLGRSEEARNRDEEARAAYDRAMAMFPRAQSPRLALVAMAGRTGDQASTTSGLLALFQASGGAGPATDPWWTYDTVHVEDLPDRWERMRQATAEAVR